MDWLWSLNSELSNWFWSYRNVIVTSWVAVLLVLYGDNINKTLKRLMRPYHYVVRILAFVVLCSVGYSILANYGEVLINHTLQLPERRWFAVIVIGVYFVLGGLAERKHQA